jgi:predicted nucleic acid-binding protein
MTHVLVDSPIWILAFRKKQICNLENTTINNLGKLIDGARHEIIGTVRQEVLSGIADKQRFEELKEKMSHFTDYDVQKEEYEFAAECFSTCMIHKVEGSYKNFLICAVAIKKEWEIFTSDAAFSEYAKYLPIKLYAEI